MGFVYRLLLKQRIQIARDRLLRKFDCMSLRASGRVNGEVCQLQKGILLPVILN